MVISPERYRPGTVRDYPIAARSSGNQRTKVRKKIKEVITAFDIETTRLTGAVSPRFQDPAGKGRAERAVMYCWQFHFNHYATIFGRTWAQCKTFFQTMASELEEDETLVIWVHNLSYEFQFLRAIYDFQPDEVFCIKSRKILKATMFDGKLEFRCSYLHCNMGLDAWTKKMQVQHQKLSGAAFDYSKIRYPWTPMDSEEIRYCVHDVVGLCECIEKEMQLDGDNLYTIPLTSTGYVRRDVKRAMNTYYNKRMVQEIFPDEEIFTMLHEAFQGGNTHANRRFAGRVLRNVKSMDRCSSYPDVECNQKFPTGQFHKFDHIDLKELKYYIFQRKKAVLVRLAVKNIRLSDPYDGCPYISLSHCRNVVKPILDNGRILEADYFEITVTDVDLKIILRQYDADNIQVISGAYAQYGNLPKEMVKTICEYYTAKTELKNVPGQELYYDKAKNKLNSIYGMTATNPAKNTIEFRADDERQYVEIQDPLSELLESARRKAFISYAWGVWCTAWARSQLQDGIDLVQDTPGAYFIYCDTDSVKYLGEVDISDFNAARVAASKRSGSYATDPQGVTHYMGVFEQERTYAAFATLGAKKYAFQYEPDGPTQVTIAGVTKKSGGAELDRGDQYGTGLERFCDIDHPFVFREAGGTEIFYRDDWEPVFNVEGQDLPLPPCAVIRPTTYTLGVTAEYESLLERDQLPLEFWAFENS